MTPEAVARAGMKLVKRKAKQKAVEYFPTFTKWGKRRPGRWERIYQIGRIGRL